MGHLHSVCIFRDTTESCDGDLGKACFDERGADDENAEEVEKMAQTMNKLLATFSELQHENDSLNRANTDLQRDVDKLKNALRKQSSEKAWRTFDVVEHHYRQLERHRKRIAEGHDVHCWEDRSTDADTGIGSGSVPTGSGYSLPPDPATEETPRALLTYVAASASLTSLSEPPTYVHFESDCICLHSDTALVAIRGQSDTPEEAAGRPLCVQGLVALSKEWEQRQTAPPLGRSLPPSPGRPAESDEPGRSGVR